MNCLARVSSIIVKGLIFSLCLFAFTANAQVLTADFSMMETGPGLNSLVKGKIRYEAEPQLLRWEFTHPNPKVVTQPLVAGNPTDEEGATMRLFGHYLQKGAFSEVAIKSLPDWQARTAKNGQAVYTQKKKNAMNARMRYANGQLVSTTFSLGDGNEVDYLYSDYTELPGYNKVPAQITTVLRQGGKKIYKRLKMKNMAVKY